MNPLAELEGRRTGIFHVATTASWSAAKARGEHVTGSLVAEGFIHCSTPAQVEGTLAAHFREVDEVMLLHIDPSRLVAELRYEPPVPFSKERGHLIFPHLYGPLNLDAVVGEVTLSRAQGAFVVPPGVRDAVL